jgi:hypothetical protein
MAGLSPYRSKARTDDPARDFAKQLEETVANGQLVEETFDTASSGSIRHSLGRPYRGAIVVGQETTTMSVFVKLPEEHDEPEASVGVVFGAFYNGLIRLWVF